MNNEKAFPSKTHLGDYDRHEVNKGMDLRDYFAAKAMQGLFSNPVYDSSKSVYNTASVCYDIADAMMEARK